jgi:hypothetical protein
MKDWLATSIYPAQLGQDGKWIWLLHLRLCLKLRVFHTENNRSLTPASCIGTSGMAINSPSSRSATGVSC